MEMFDLRVRPDGIALITFDVPGRSMNILSETAIRELGEIAARVRSDTAIVGAILASGKASGFCAGADLGEIGRWAGVALGTDPEAIADRLAQFSALSRALRDLETCGKPVAVALTGLALGGGCEIALAAHYRLAASDRPVKLGLPEATIGLLPGAGGTQRLPRLIGVRKALEMMLDGKPVAAQDALSLGAIDAMVPAADIIEAAAEWIRGGGDGVARWDRPGFRPPGGAVFDPAIAADFAFLSASTHRQGDENYPAKLAILKCVYEGLLVPVDAGLRIETRYFVQTLATPQAKAMVRSLFLSSQALAKGGARPAGFAAFAPRTVAIIGAGMMGAGIAHVQAQHGLRTILIDVSDDVAAKGKAHSRKLLDRAIARGQTTPEEADRRLALIEPTADYGRVADVDLVIESVFEDRAVKTTAIAKAEAYMRPDAIFASNTSALPITGLAMVAKRPENFIGIHFFSPVERMALVEIVVGRETAPATVAAAFDYALALGKTPIRVNDGRGFYTTRCFVTFIDEGIELLLDGIAPALIDNVGRQTGMPRGPLELNDDVALDLVHKGRVQAARDLGGDYRASRTDTLVATMVESLGRHGRKNGRGFYDYQEDGNKRLWPGLAELAPVRSAANPGIVTEIRERLLYRQALEAARCVAEGIVTDPRDANVGAILGWGFAPWTGGPLSLIDSVGAAPFVDACRRLSDRYGERFAPPELLLDMARSGGRFYREERTA